MFGNILITVNGLLKKCGSTTALGNDSLHVKEGTIHRLIGPNGAGKSTTIVATLAMLWILLPIFSVAVEMILSMVQTVVMISPITQDLMVLYGRNNVLVIQYAIIQFLVALVLIILSIIVFIKQDIEY
ncbi:MAG: ATP-binding cassette domain-containing protein [ANME-2 cluster archaeon]|nr:ATP-binding cassette domain-containing protein [ANME-2 cluster archaeon]